MNEFGGEPTAIYNSTGYIKLWKDIEQPRGRVSLVVHYRSFRNDDPPGLADIWNQAFSGRGAVQLRHSSPLERFAFAKPYFDPAGLIVAVDNGVPVGFVHAGFGPNDTESALSTAVGVTCAIGVRPSHRRRGIGTELLRRSESYLSDRGAQTIYAGPQRPLNPFYFGVYGGSDSPGFLTSDTLAEPFLQARGYQPAGTCLVFHRNLTRALNVVDPRFAAIRQSYEIRVMPRSGIISWWQECTLGPVEVLEFRLEDKSTRAVAARAGAWEMEGFSWRWGLPAVGLVDLVVQENLRRQGLGKFLLTSILRYLQDQYFGLVEAQALESNAAAMKLLQGTGFEQVDLGRIYRKQP
jgi:ribosomal protein S18 acetylase RimI-like enzyme